MLLRIASRLCAALLVCILGACAGAPTVNVTAADRALIKKVNVKSDVVVPADIFFHGRAQSFAAVGGVIGAVAGQSLAQEPKAQLIDLMKSQGISMQDLLKQEFIRASAKGPISFAEGASDPNAEVSFVVNIYGFGQTQGFSALLYPMLNVTATMKKPDGSIAWQKTEFASPLNSENNQGYEFEQYTKNPELIRQVLANISGVVSRMLVADLSASK